MTQGNKDDVVGKDLFAAIDLGDGESSTTPSVMFRGENIFQALDEVIRMGYDGIGKRGLIDGRYEYVGLNSEVMQEEQQKFLAHRQPLPGEEEFSNQLCELIAKHLGPFTVHNHQARMQALMGICVDHFAVSPRLPVTDVMWRTLLTYAPKHLCEVYPEGANENFAEYVNNSTHAQLASNSFMIEPTWTPETQHLFVPDHIRAPESVYYGIEKMKLTAFIASGKTINLLDEFAHVPNLKTLEAEGRLNLRISRLLMGFREQGGEFQNALSAITPFGDAFDLGWGRRPIEGEKPRFGGNIRAHIALPCTTDAKTLPSTTLGVVDLRFDIEPAVVMDTSTGDFNATFQFRNVEVDLNHVNKHAVDFAEKAAELIPKQLGVIGYELCVTIKNDKEQTK
jgi:hypothetical protein